MIRFLIALLGGLSALLGLIGAYAVGMQWESKYGTFAENREIMVQFFMLAVLCFIAVQSRSATARDAVGSGQGET